MPEHDTSRPATCAWADFGGQSAIVSHAGVTAAARDAVTFRSGSPGPGFPVFATTMPMIGSDPPLHRDFRIPFQARFSPGSAEAMRPHIRNVITGLINNFIERGSADLAKELCIPLPARIAGELLDLPEGSRAELSQWAARIVAEGPESSAYAQLAGMDTTSNGGALMLHYLATHPDARAEIVAHPGQLEPAVEELLRLTSPVPHPDAFDINRKPNRHYAFGFAAHRCLGANLARVELQVLIQEVLRRLPDYQVVPAEVVRYPGLNRGMSGLGARFTPGSREEAEQ
jgi:cytochrome P450